MRRQFFQATVFMATLFGCISSANATPGGSGTNGSQPNCTSANLTASLTDNVFSTGITVDEYGCSDGGFNTGGYYNLFNPSSSGVSVFGLAVTTDSYFSAPDYFEPGTGVSNWTAEFLNEGTWNGRFSATFDDTFGPSSVQGVYLYMVGIGGSTIAPGFSVTGSNGFYFGSVPTTEFAALANGQVIAQSFAPPSGQAPTPATITLLVIGLLGAGATRRRWH